MSVQDRLTAGFWQGKRVLVTGHTGFKGGWLALWLQRLGAQVTGVSLPPCTQPNLYTLGQVADCCQSHFCDIRTPEPFAALVKQADPEIVFHLAAQPLVRASYDDPVGTLASNVMGTAHLLEALRQLNRIRVAVMVTTDKVYHNNESPLPYREDDTLGGHDPYSASKAASEIVIGCYRAAFLAERGVAVSSARAGNVIGGGDWSADRLVPDAMRAWRSGQTLTIRRPQAIRPWQHVLEPLAGYLALAQASWAEPGLADAYNFGPATDEAATVRQVVELAREGYGVGAVQFCDDTAGPHEAGWLALETAKARFALGLKPRWALRQAVQRTMDWYRAQHEGADARSLCLAQIHDYEALLQ